MITIPVSLSGRHRLNAIRPDGSRRPLLDWRDNIILDRGLDDIANVSTYLDSHHVGGGDATPVSEQLALQSPIASTSNRVSANSAAESVSPYRGYSQITWRYPVGAVVGEIREVGVGSSAVDGDPLFCRALALDALDSPTGVEVLADEQLEAIYELSITMPEDDITGQFAYTGIDGEENTVSYTLRPSQANSSQYWSPYNASGFASPGQAVRALFESSGGLHCAVYSGGIGGITSTPGGDQEACSLVINDDYVEGSHQLVAHIGITEDVGNFETGIKSVLIRLGLSDGAGGDSLGAWQVEFTPALVKNNEYTAYFDVALSWGRS